MVESKAEVTKNETENSKSPKVPEWLNAQLFEGILKHDLQNFATIENFDVVPAVSTGENYMTVLLRILLELKLEDATTTKTSYVAKVLPVSEQMQTFISEWKVFNKEAEMYGKYVPAFERLFQKAGKVVKFGAKRLTIAPSRDDALILEDLRLKGFKNAQRQIGFDMTHTQHVLKKLAQFHAASVCYFEQEGAYPEIFKQSFYIENGTDQFVEHRANICRLFRESLPLYNNATHLDEQLSNFSRNTPDPYQSQPPACEDEFNVLNHGDLWANNVMFQYDAEGALKETFFVDFQLCRYGSPAQDLYYMLLSSTAIENKFKKFEYFIYYYHQQLIANLNLLGYTKPMPTLKSLHIALFKYSDWPFTICTLLLPMVLLDPSENAHVDNFIADSEEADNLKREMYTNARYVKQMCEFLPWLERRGLLEYQTQNAEVQI